MLFYLIAALYKNCDPKILSKLTFEPELFTRPVDWVFEREWRCIINGLADRLDFGLVLLFVQHELAPTHNPVSFLDGSVHF